MSWPAAWAIVPCCPPAGHAPKDELRVSLQADVRSETEPLHDPGAEALDQPVRLFHQVEDGCNRFWALQVHRQRAPAAVQDVELRTPASVRPPVDPHHFGPQVREHHGAEGPRSDAGDLENAVAVQWSHSPLSPGERWLAVEAGQYRRRPPGLPYNPVADDHPIRQFTSADCRLRSAAGESLRPCSDTE